MKRWKENRKFQKIVEENTNQTNKKMTSYTSQRFSLCMPPASFWKSGTVGAKEGEHYKFEFDEGGVDHFAITTEGTIAEEKGTKVKRKVLLGLF